MTNEDASNDAVRVSVLVEADQPTAFRLFIEETDGWWKRGAKFRIAGSNHGALHLEPFLHGRLFESFDAGSVTRVVRMGRVQVWEPPRRIALEWRAPDAAPSELTEVEVTFEPTGPATRLTVSNRGWSKFEGGRDLDARSAFWTELLNSLAELAVER